MHRFNEPTITYGAGRFVVDIPAAMSFAGGYHLRNRKIEEVIWRDTDTEKAAEQAWEKRLTEIEAMPPPQGVEKALIEIIDVPDIQKWCRAVFYYGDPLDTELPGIPLKGYLDILCHTGRTDLWITSYGKSSAKDFMYRKSTDIARAYRAPEKRFDRAEIVDGRDAFYLRYGAVDLPFEYKESVDIVFREHALDDRLKIHIMTWVVHEESKIGLLERAANSLMMKLVGDLKIEKLRAGRRTVAGLPGEELIERFTENGRSTLSFTWMHLGKKDSAHWPRVVVDMESRDGHLEEKLDLWDAILNSLRPAGK